MYLSVISIVNEAELIILFQADYGKKLNTEVLPKYFAFMAKLLKKNGGTYLVGSKVTLITFYGGNIKKYYVNIDNYKIIE